GDGRIHADRAADGRRGRRVGGARRHDGRSRGHVPARGRIRAEDAFLPDRADPDRGAGGDGAGARAGRVPPDLGPGPGGAGEEMRDESSVTSPASRVAAGKPRVTRQMFPVTGHASRVTRICPPPRAIWNPKPAIRDSRPATRDPRPRTLGFTLFELVV